MAGTEIEKLAKSHEVTPSEIALAWLLKRSPVMLPIPGTSKVAHLEENVAAADIQLSDEEFAALDAEGKGCRLSRFAVQNKEAGFGPPFFRARIIT